MATIMSHNLPLIPLPLKATTAAALAKTTAGLMMSGLLGKHPGEDIYGNGALGLPTDRSSPDVASSEARSSPESLMMVQQKEREDDRMSCCSDDSELSVGQEGLDGSDKTMNSVEKLNVISANSRMNGVDIEKLIDRHSVEVGDEVSNDSSRYSSSKDPSEDFMKIPLMRPSPTRLHEEFLRNSQLYAEELMRQQMQIVAAARGLNLSPKPLEPGLGLVTRLQDNRSPGRIGFIDEQKIGFRPHIRGVGEIYQDRHRWSDERSVQSPPESSSFRGIHSHLSAISQITQNLNSDISKLTSPSSLTSMTSRESSQSPPQAAAHLLQMNNNIALNDQNLKFSIDNILKADFGRRITDPLKRSGKSYAKKPSAPGEKPTAMDLTAVEKLSAVIANGTSSGSANNSAGSVASRSLSSSASGSEIEVPTSPTSSSGKAGETGSGGGGSSSSSSGGPMVWPAWVYCTRYSDRPSSGPRARKPKKSPSEKAPPSSGSGSGSSGGGGGGGGSGGGALGDDKRPRTAFSGPQLARLKHEFAENRYLTERRRQQLSGELGLNEAQIKIWFQNKRAKIKKSSGQKNPLALQLMAQGLYNHSTIPLTREEEELQEMQAAAQAAAESRIGSSPASG